jgi:hypothetical protein
MGFEAIQEAGNKSNGNFTKMSSDDYKKLEDYMIETCNIEEEETIVGVISGIHDLGLQKQDDAKTELKAGENKDEIMKKFPETYFETIDGKEYKCYPRPAAPKVAVTVDFPEIMINKGQFFSDGEGEEHPLRLILNGEFILSGGTRIVSRPLTAKNTEKLDAGWSISPKNTLYKMAKGAKLVNNGEPFEVKQLGSLLGKALQFNVQVFRNSKGYYTEVCKYASGLGRGQKAPELAESYITSVFLGDDNKEEDLKNLRASVRNTMMLSETYKDSAIREQFKELFPYMEEQYKKISGQEDKKKEAKAKELADAPDFDAPEEPEDEGIDIDFGDDGDDSPFEE